MIEAIPLNADCIVLIITKVEDPEELDTRFPVLRLPLRKTVMKTVMRARQTRFWICSAVSKMRRLQPRLPPLPLRGKTMLYVPPVPYGSESGDQRCSRCRSLSWAQHSVSRRGYRRVLSDPDAGRRRSRGLRPCLQCHL